MLTQAIGCKHPNLCVGEKIFKVIAQAQKICERLFLGIKVKEKVDIAGGGLLGSYIRSKKANPFHAICCNGGSIGGQHVDNLIFMKQFGFVVDYC